MKAAIYKGDPRLIIEEVPKPEIFSGEALVKVSACGVCHTDLHYLDHGVGTFKKPPLILGHEVSGVVYAVSSDVKNIKEGDVVLVPPVISCGFCEYCRRGRENICDNMKMFGNHIDGGYAEFIKVPAKDLILLPSGLPVQECSIIADAVSTPFHAVVNRAKVLPGEYVAVFGCGGVGINCVQVASALGGVVLAIDIDENKLSIAKELGAFEILNVKNSQDIAKDIKKITRGGVDVAFEVIGNPITINQAYNSVRKGGRVCIVGYTNKVVDFIPAKLMFNEIEMIGSLGCRPVDYPRLISMVKAGKIKVEPLVTKKFSLEEINNAFDNLRAGKGIRSIIAF